MSHWGDYILQQPVTHMSKSFDGHRLDNKRCRVDGGASDESPCDAFCKGSTEYIAGQPPRYDVLIVEKQHFSFLQLLDAYAGKN
eukprot:5646246-Karenia_brevis.AAC.1